MRDTEKYTRQNQHQVKIKKLHLIELPIGFSRSQRSYGICRGNITLFTLYALSEHEVAEVKSTLEHLNCTVHFRASFEQQSELMGSFAAPKRPLG